MSIQQLIDDTLTIEQEKKSSRVRSGKFSPSSFGKCYRAQYWNRKNEPVTNPPSVEALRRFKVGNIIHQFVQGFFPQAQTEVIVLSGDDMVGYADIVLPDEVVDIKSCRAYEFKTFAKKDYDIREGKYTNCLQVCTYALFLNKPQARLIFIEKDALDSKEFVIETKDFKEQIEDELEILRGHWKKQELPKAIPRAYGGKECSYCAFKDKCDAIEKEAVK